MDTPSLPQSIRLAGVRNARELGGYAAPGHQRVRRGVLLRTAHLAAATEEDLRRLTEEFSLGCIVDFRTTAEWSNQPDRSVPGAAYYHLLVVDESDPNGSIARDTAQFQRGDYHQVLLDLVASGRYNTNIYVDMLLSPWGLEAYRAFFRLLLRNNGGRALLFHCTAGKDRTGIAAALLLSALGVGRETVLEDFVLTNRYLTEQISAAVDAVRASGADDEVIQLVRGLAGVDRSCLETLLDTLDERYGGVPGFLSAELGFSQEELARLRELYLE